MQLDIDIEAVWPSHAAPQEWEALAARVAEAAAKVAPELSDARLQVSLMFTSDAEIRTLNKQWRDRDKPTNVLSFPMLEREDMLSLARDGDSVGVGADNDAPEMPPILIGDIALAYETCAREAAEKSATLENHAAHLILHGLLHLAGLDHEISTADAEAMETLEIKALAIMGIADPYGD